MTAPMLLALLLLLIGTSAVVAALAASPPRLVADVEPGTDIRWCGPCAADTTHLVTANGCGTCATCRAENPRYTAAA